MVPAEKAYQKYLSLMVPAGKAYEKYLQWSMDIEGFSACSLLCPTHVFFQIYGRPPETLHQLFGQTETDTSC